MMFLLLPFRGTATIAGFVGYVSSGKSPTNSFGGVLEQTCMSYVIAVFHVWIGMWWFTLLNA